MREDERRKEPRYDHRITLRTVSDDRGLVEMESANIGPGGAYCISPCRFDEMARLEVVVFLQDAEHATPGVRQPLRLESVVVRSEPTDNDRFNIALFFPKVTAEQRALLKAHLPPDAQRS